MPHLRLKLFDFVYIEHITVHVHSSSLNVPGRISTRQGKQYSTNTDYMSQNGIVRQMNNLLIVKGKESLSQTQMF